MTFRPSITDSIIAIVCTFLCSLFVLVGAITLVFGGHNPLSYGFILIGSLSSYTLCRHLFTRTTLCEGELVVSIPWLASRRIRWSELDHWIICADSDGVESIKIVTQSECANLEIHSMQVSNPGFALLVKQLRTIVPGKEQAEHSNTRVLNP